MESELRRSSHGLSRGSNNKKHCVLTVKYAYNTVAFWNDAGKFADIVKKSMRGDYYIVTTSSIRNKGGGASTGRRALRIWYNLPTSWG